MALLARGQASDGLNPVLELFTPVQGMLAQPEALAFQIFDVSDADRRVQIFPETAGTRAAVNIEASWPDGDRLGPGHFVARWAAPTAESIGAHEIHWFLRSTAAGPEQTIACDFDVVAEVAGSSAAVYALVSDLRAEGVTANDASDVRLARLLRLASRYVDRITGRFFRPKAMTLTVDGSGRRAQLLGPPIIGIGDVRMFAGMLAGAADLADLPVIPAFFRVYARHLTQGLVDPDDRENPKLEFFHESDLVGVHATPAAQLGLGSLVWLPGVQNVVIDGVYGYTDPDGTPAGRTPELIRHVTKLLVMRELPAMADFAWREDRRQRWRLTSERTRDQSYNLDALRAQGIFTGDPEIDALLVAYQRPPQLGAA